MNKRDINELYEQSVYQIRLHVAIGLLVIPGIDARKALREADNFVEMLLSEDVNELKRRLHDAS
jgi:hypothetical protein